MNTEAIQRALDRLGQSLRDDAAAHYALLLEELAHWNARVNLTAIRDPAAMITAHLLDSLVVRPLVYGMRIADVGTGAGFPGLPLAIAEPERRFVLLDRQRKKIAFVEHVIARLGLDNVFAVQTRAEDYAPDERFDTVIARAVGPLDRLVAMAGHLVAEGGVFIAMKGRYPAAEVDQLPGSWRCEIRVLDVPGLERGSRHAVLMYPS